MVAPVRMGDREPSGAAFKSLKKAASFRMGQNVWGHHLGVPEAAAQVMFPREQFVEPRRGYHIAGVRDL